MLHDIDEERLGYAEALVRRINEQSGAVARVGSSLDRQAAVEGADYVINEIQVGGYRATRADFDIPRATASARPFRTRSVSAAFSVACARSRC
jgi:alpha-galactosidase/6-phospho-beta-glucosidase family protein